MTELLWRIYYGDGSTFSNLDGEPVDAPSFDFQCVVQPDELVGRSVMAGWDWYYYRPDLNEWWGSDLPGLLDHLLHRLPVEAVCQGRHSYNPVYSSIIKRAQEDPDFPKRSASRAIAVVNSPQQFTLAG